jgi:hypothetical protein
MIAGQQIDRNAGAAEPAHGGGEVEPRAHVSPVAVIKIARDDEEIDAPVDRGVDQPAEGGTGRAPHLLHRHAVVAGEAVQR